MTKLCLTLRDGQPTMESCAAADRAALWAIADTSAVGALIKNKVGGTSLARMADRVSATTFSRDASRRRDVINGL
ncbi:hypothetical protein ACWFQ8_18645 [Streptomyces sp. NPDC055254]